MSNHIILDLDADQATDEIRRFFNLTEQEASSAMGCIATSRCLGSAGAKVELRTGDRLVVLDATREYGSTYMISEGKA